LHLVLDDVHASSQSGVTSEEKGSLNRMMANVMSIRAPESLTLSIVEIGDAKP
jgi:hypothetical protein